MNGTKAGLDLDLDAIKAVPEVEHFEGGESWVHLSAWERDALVAEVERLRNENRVLRNAAVSEQERREAAEVEVERLRSGAQHALTQWDEATPHERDDLSDDMYAAVAALRAALHPQEPSGE